MCLGQQITDYINAAFAGLWIQTQEPDEAEREIVRHAKSQGWKVIAYDIAGGIRFATESVQVNAGVGADDPIAFLKTVPSLATPDGSVLVLLHAFHRFLNQPEIIQTVFSQLIAGKQQRIFLLILAPIVQLPPELEKLFVVLDHALPDRSQLETIARQLLADRPEDIPQGDDLDRVLSAAAGLTRYESEGAFALSIARHDSLRPETIWELKTQSLRKSGLCSLYRGETKAFEQLHGVDQVRQLTSKLLRPSCPIPPKGWLFVGPPNCGKTTVAKAIAADHGLPLIVCDLPSLKNSHVGESERRVRQFISLCEAMQPCCCLIDEIEDALAGGTAETSGDSGVSRDQLSAILKWRSESKSRVFLMATCNDPESLLKVKQGAFVRDGRFDGIMYFDLPGRKAKDAMWEMYRQQHGLADDEPNPADDGWAPGNIEVCCQRAVQYEVSLAQAAMYVRPSPAADIDKLREWADSRCLSASEPGLYRKPGNNATTSSPKPSRKINRGPSLN